MPELPEVETIRRGLEPLLRGRRFRDATLRERRLREPVRPAELRRLQGARIDQVRRRSKYLLLDTSEGDTLLIHLGMSGQLWVSEDSRPARAHEHLALRLDDGRQLRFADTRRFGMVRVLRTRGLDRHPRLRGLGPEPLEEALTAAGLHAATRGRRKPVKNLLLDTREIAGVGNIYACESLHRAGIHPRRQVHRIGPAGWTRLVASLREVLLEAIDMGGTTLRDFRNAEEQAGYFAISLRVYDREGQPCPREDGIVRRIVQAGRSTFFCPRCQR
ncbi:MAG: bifunctional DNA-formamidopyrimidine glycosylase/DNA-(apurinic or apyrimidinic site) lyase [Acidobacteriota bacterium]|jgi:formamidopyrimidine-DNA glycosylase